MTRTLLALAITAVLAPSSAVDQSKSDAPAREVAVLAGGCFWGVQGVYQHMNGVTRAVSGYAGGGKQSAIYEMVGMGTTGHAESVEVTFDPKQISYEKILEVFFAVVHDPTQLNRQGPDEGPQYRSAIFPLTDQQAAVAKAYIDQLGKSGTFKRKIVTTIESGKPFYPAEAYHQDFLTRHPNYPYIVYNDLPKIEDLKKRFPDLYREKPVLVNAPER